MSDIVDRLKKRLAEEAVGCINAPVIGYTGDGRLLMEAADKIERLQAALRGEYVERVYLDRSEYEALKIEVKKLRAELENIREPLHDPSAMLLTDPLLVARKVIEHLRAVRRQQDNEIEHLRASVEELTKGPEWEQVYQEIIGELRAEIERLRAALQTMQAALEGK